MKLNPNTLLKAAAYTGVSSDEVCDELTETRGGQKPTLPIAKKRVSHSVRVLPKTKKRILRLKKGFLGKLLDDQFGGEG